MLGDAGPERLQLGIAETGQIRGPEQTDRFRHGKGAEGSCFHRDPGFSGFPGGTPAIAVRQLLPALKVVPDAHQWQLSFQDMT